MSKNKKLFLINFATALFSQLVTLVVGFLVPRLLMSNYGSDTNGLVSTVTQVFTYLSLLEAGITTAAKNALFKPIKENDRDCASKIISLARKSFRIASGIYLLFVLVIGLVLPVALKTKVDYWTVFFVVLFEGLSNVVSFYFISTWTTVLYVDGKNYVINIVDLISKILCYTIKVAFILKGYNIALIQAGFFVVSIMKVLVFGFYFRKKYAWIQYVKSDKCAKLPDKNAYLIAEIAWTAFNSTDLIIVGIFLGTMYSSVYSTYNMIIVGFTMLLNSIFGAVSYVLGKTYHENVKKYTFIHDSFNSLFMFLVTTTMSVSCILMIPFIKLYTSGINDVNYIYSFYPMMFCSIPILSWSRYVSGNLCGVAGYAKSTIMASIIEAVVNIGSSILFVQFLGIYGVLLGTIIALPIKVIYLNYLVEKKILCRKTNKTVLILLSNYLVFAISAFLSFFYEESINTYGDFIFHGLKLTLLIGSITLLINIVVNKSFLTILNRKSRYK